MNLNIYENQIKRDLIEHTIRNKIKYLDEIASEMESGCLTVFAGAGLSVSSGYLDWKKLLKPMSEQLGLDINMDLTVLAQYYENEFGRNGLNCAIHNEFAKVPQRNDNMEILATFPVTNFWTTNYDSVIEDTLRDKGRTVDVVTEQVQYKYHGPNRDAIVYKMHGDKLVPDKAVLTKKDYEVYDKTHDIFTKGLILELITNAVLFIGFGFSDPNLDRILSIVRHTFEEYAPKNHYCFMRGVNYKNYIDDAGVLTKDKRQQYEQDKREQEFKIRNMEDYGIYTILVDEFEQITTMLKYIRTKYTMNKVFISGGLDSKNSTLSYGDIFGKKMSNDKFLRGERFIMSLSKRIMDEGYDIISGFGVGVGNYVVAGAYMSSRYDKKDYIADHLHIQPIISVDEQQKDMKQYIREKLIEDCGIVVTLFGKTVFQRKTNKIQKCLNEDGTYIEYKLAKEQKKIIIPVGITGFTSKYIYNEERNFNIKSELNSLMGKLDDEKLDDTELINSIIELINMQKQTKVQEMKEVLMKDFFTDTSENINVFLSFHYKSTEKYAKLISNIINQETNMSVAEEFKKVSSKETRKWIDSKIENTQVTLLLLNENIICSKWIDYEINSSINNGNAFVLVDITNGKFEYSKIEKYKIGTRSIADVYGVYKIHDCNNEEEFNQIVKWIKETIEKKRKKSYM